MTSGSRAKKDRQSQGRAGGPPGAGGSRPPKGRALQELRAKQRRQRLLGGGIGAVVLVVVVVLAVVLIGHSTSSSNGTGTTSAKIGPTRTLAALGPLKAPPKEAPGPEAIGVPKAPQLAGLATAATGQPVDGISCDTTEQVVYHIHVHVTVFVNGAQRQIPPGIGIVNPQGQQTPQGVFISSGSCFYWLHTHAADGIIHIESPSKQTFTLGDFFDIWGQTLSTTQVGPATGHVTTIVNGRQYLGNPRTIPLDPHTQIQLEVGKPLVAPVKVTNWHGL